MLLEPYVMSGEKTASAVISDRPGLLMGIDFLPPSSGTAILKIYDSASATTSGKTIIFEALIAAGTSTSSLSLPMARFVSQGIYAVLTDGSTSALFNVGYSRL